MSTQPQYGQEEVGDRLTESQKKVLYDTMGCTVVAVEVFNKMNGVGVVISEAGHILTVSRILEDDVNTRVQIRTREDKVFDAKIVKIDPSQGLAIIKVTKPPTPFPFADITREELEIGEDVYGIGHSLYLDCSFPEGHISFPSRRYQEVVDSLPKGKEEEEKYGADKEENMVFKDVSKQFIRYVDDLSDLKLSPDVELVQVNNVHGVGMAGSTGLPLFSRDGYVDGLYLFMVFDQVYAVHARSLNSFVASGLE